MRGGLDVDPRHVPRLSLVRSTSPDQPNSVNGLLARGGLVCSAGVDMEPLERARWEGLYRSHAGQVFAFAFRRVGREDAADVVAETFLVAWRRIGEVPTDQARAWLYRTARNVVANELRAGRRRHRLDLHARASVPADHGVTGDHAAEVTEQVRVRTVLRSLSPLDQEVLRLTEWERLDLAEVAIALGCSRTAVKVRLHRARRRFAARLAAADSAPDPVADSPARPAQTPNARPAPTPGPEPGPGANHRRGPLPTLLPEGSVTA
jgi:RNA polymerase sigma-70 factor, ECF subfamily